MNVIKKKHLLLLSFLSAILLSLAWPLRGFPFLIFIALIPLLMVLEQIRLYPDRFRKMASFRYTYLAFFFWNLFTTFWVWNASEVGALFAFFVNSAVMALTIQLAVFIRDNALRGNPWSLFSLPLLWVSFEFLHQHWDLSWPWLNIGNVFATRPAWVQWYEFTGVAGGTLWVWLINLALFRILLSFMNQANVQVRARRITIVSLLLLLLLPSAWSFHRYYSYVEKSDPVDVIIVQPNLDPYTEEYQLTVPQVLDRILTPLKGVADERADIIVAPESVLQEGMYEDEFQYSLSLAGIKQFLKENSPQASFVVGTSTFRMIPPGEPLGPSARRYNSKSYYEAFNTALFLDTACKPLAYHKSKLVPGVEQMPFVALIKPIEKLAIDLGGTVGTLGKSDDRTVYSGARKPVSAVICYESVYGEFVGDFVKNGAEIMLILTNDGWWNDTPGHRQHFIYSTLRAIETRRPIARAANTGISCFVNQRGDVVQQTEYWTRDVIRGQMNANTVMTFYVQHGDYLGRGFTFASALMLLIALLQYFVWRIHRRKTSLNG